MASNQSSTPRPLILHFDTKGRPTRFAEASGVHVSSITATSATILDNLSGVAVCATTISATTYLNIPAGGGGGVTALSSLGDVSITATPPNMQVLAWNNAGEVWVPAFSATVLTNLSSLSDVQVTSTPSNLQILAWSTAQHRWVNTTNSAGVTTFVALTDTTGGHVANQFMVDNGTTIVHSPFTGWTTTATFNAHTAAVNPHSTNFTDLVDTTAGHVANQFLVDNGTTIVHSPFTGWTTTATFDTHENAVNPHNTNFINLVDTTGGHVANQFLIDNGTTIVHSPFTTWATTATVNAHTTNVNNPHNTSLNNLNDTTINSDETIIASSVIMWDTSKLKWQDVLAPLNQVAAGDVTYPAAPTMGQALTWDAVDGRWEPSAVPTLGAQTLDDHSDVTITSPTMGQVLTYDAVGGNWENSAAPTGGAGTFTDHSDTFGSFTGRIGDILCVSADATFTGVESFASSTFALAEETASSVRVIASDNIGAATTAAAYTDIFNATIPAGTMGVHDAVRVTLIASAIQQTGSSKVGNIKVLLGGTTVWQEAYGIPNESNQSAFEITFIIKNIASVSSQRTTGRVAWGVGAGVVGYGNWGQSISTYDMAWMGIPTSINMDSADRAVQVQWSWSGGGDVTNAHVECWGGYIEHLKGVV